MRDKGRGVGLRLFIHDFGRFAFTLDMARWLAAQGHTVLYCWCDDIEVPGARPAPRPDDPPGLHLKPLSLGAAMPKYQPLRRWRYEGRYGRLSAAAVAAFRPDRVISAHAPPRLQAALLASARRAGCGFVAWIGDLMSVVAARALPRMLPLAGHWLHVLVRHWEFRALAAADRVIAVSSDFVAPCLANGVALERIAVLPSWEPLASGAPESGWLAAHDLVGRRLVIYAGTLGLKHDPALLADLAAALADRPEVRVVVATQGLGRAWLEQARRERDLANLVLLDYQHGDAFAAFLAAAEVAVALLEPYAASGCVPLKVWSYLAAGCPVVAAIPLGNPAAAAVAASAAGLVVGADGLAAGVAALLDDPARRLACGAAGRRYAEQAFSLADLGPRFFDLVEAVP